MFCTMEPSRITPAEAKLASDADLTLWANRYRVNSGAHTVVQHEIERRASRRKNTTKVLVAIFVGAIGLAFYLLRHLF